jgi:hypothetical protein
MHKHRVQSLVLLIVLWSSACILRPGMNADCAWPPEPHGRLDLASGADRRHLVVDAELIEELVDRSLSSAQRAAGVRATPDRYRCPCTRST